MRTGNDVKIVIAVGLAVSLSGCTTEEPKRWATDDPSASSGASADDGDAPGGDGSDGSDGTGSGSDEAGEGPDGTGADAGGAAAREACGALDAATVETLAGAALELTEAVAGPGRLRCTWGDPSKTRIHVFQAPAAEWAGSELAPMTDQIGGAPEKLVAGVRAIRRGEVPSDARSCELVNLFMDAAAYERGADGATLRAASGLSIMGMTCTGGTLSSLHVIREDKKVAKDAADVVDGALASLSGTTA